MLDIIGQWPIPRRTVSKINKKILPDETMWSSWRNLKKVAMYPSPRWVQNLLDAAGCSHLRGQVSHALLVPSKRGLPARPSGRIGQPTAATSAWHGTGAARWRLRAGSRVPPARPKPAGRVSGAELRVCMLTRWRAKRRATGNHPVGFPTHQALGHGGCRNRPRRRCHGAWRLTPICRSRARSC